MSDILRKLNALQKKANIKNKELVLEVDLILDESHIKYDWNDDTWLAYAEHEKQKGNKVILLSQRHFKSNTGDSESLEAYEDMEHD